MPKIESHVCSQYSTAGIEKKKKKDMLINDSARTVFFKTNNMKNLQILPKKARENGQGELWVSFSASGSQSPFRDNNATVIIYDNKNNSHSGSLLRVWLWGNVTLSTQPPLSVSVKWKQTRSRISLAGGVGRFSAEGC